MITMRLEPGWAGVFTRHQAAGAIANGTRVRKVVSELGDAHPVGSLGTVLGSLRVPAEMRAQHPRAQYAYFIEWDDTPRAAVATSSYKIAEA